MIISKLRVITISSTITADVWNNSSHQWTFRDANGSVVPAPTITVAPGGSSTLYGPDVEPGVKIGASNAVRGDFIELDVDGSGDYGYVTLAIDVVDGAGAFMVQAFDAGGALVGETLPSSISDVNDYSVLYFNGIKRPVQQSIDNETPVDRNASYTTVDPTNVNIECSILNKQITVSLEITSPVTTDVTVAVLDGEYFTVYNRITLGCEANTPTSFDLVLANLAWDESGIGFSGVVCVYGNQTLVTNDFIAERLVPLNTLPVGTVINMYVGPTRPVAIPITVPFTTPVTDVSTYLSGGNVVEYKWYSFVTPTNITNLNINTLASPNGGDTSIGLYTQDGGRVSKNDDFNPDANNHLSAIVTNIPAGKYYIAVSGYGTVWPLDAFPIAEYDTFKGVIGNDIILKVEPPAPRPVVNITPADRGNIFAGYNNTTFALSCLDTAYDRTFRCRFLNHDGSDVYVSSAVNNNAGLPTGGFRENNSFIGGIELPGMGDWIDVAYDDQAGCFHVVASNLAKKEWYGAVRSFLTTDTLVISPFVGYCRTRDDVSLFGELSDVENTREVELTYDGDIDSHILTSTSNGLYEVSISIEVSTSYENAGITTWEVGLVFVGDPGQVTNCRTIFQHHSTGVLDRTTAIAIGIVEPKSDWKWMVKVSSLIQHPEFQIQLRVDMCEIRIRKIERKTVFSTPETGEEV